MTSDERKEYLKAWREKNKDKIGDRKEYFKAYREKNKDKTRAYEKKYYLKNKEKALRVGKLWVINNPERAKVYQEKAYLKKKSDPDFLEKLQVRRHKRNYGELWEIKKLELDIKRELRDGKKN